MRNYILREAGAREESHRLGPIGGRIVAHVLVGLVDADAECSVQQLKDGFREPRSASC
jgi:hypothetical protein